VSADPTHWGAAAEPADVISMSASFSAIWSSTGLARKAVLPADQTVVAAAAAPVEVVPTTGRHAEPEWSRELFDGTRDEDPFEWLGFAPDLA
jgi:hypothetical protein